MNLLTDFREPYDQYLRFLLTKPWERISTKGPDKREQFRTMESMGLRTVPHGDLMDLWYGPVVEYTDLSAHCGEGKVFHPKNPKICGKYGSEYQYHTESIRYLFIGSYVAKIRYEKSVTDWRSNYNPVSITTIDAWEGNVNHGPVLCAVDMVEGLACDYNVAPGMPDDLPWTWQEIAEEISRFLA